MAASWSPSVPITLAVLTAQHFGKIGRKCNNECGRDVQFAKRGGKGGGGESVMGVVAEW
jgi:hypothetical protein